MLPSDSRSEFFNFVSTSAGSRKRSLLVSGFYPMFSICFLVPENARDSCDNKPDTNAFSSYTRLPCHKMENRHKIIYSQLSNLNQLLVSVTHSWEQWNILLQISGSAHKLSSFVSFCTKTDRLVRLLHRFS